MKAKYVKERPVRHSMRADAYVGRWLVLFIVLCICAPASAIDGALTHSPAWMSTEGNVPAGVGWGDFNNDGWLDLAVSYGVDSDFDHDRIYFNTEGVLSPTPGWESDDQVPSGNLYIADFNNDGFPGLAISSLGSNQGYDPVLHSIYFNDGELSTTPGWNSEPSNSFSCAAGDYDGDGDMDIAFAQGTNSLTNPDWCKTLHAVIYRNNGGVFESTPVWQTDSLYNSVDIAFCDIDNDGDLDLALTGRDMGVAIFTNDAGVLETSPSWQTPYIMGGRQMEFGDVDGDGYRDLAVAGIGTTFYLFKNIGGTLELFPSWSCDSYNQPSCVSWADVDNDGDLDLAGAGWFSQFGIFENDGGMLSYDFTWTYMASGMTSWMQQLAWGDFDEDFIVDTTKTISGDGTRKLYYLDAHPIHEFGSVEIDGVPLALDQYCFDAKEGYVSLAQPPGAGVEVVFTYSFSRDLDLAATGGGRVAVFKNQTVTDPNDVNVLLMTCNTYGANYCINDAQDNIREQFESHGWNLVVTAPTQAVTPCSYGSGIGCPTLRADCLIDDIQDIHAYDALVLLPGSNNTALYSDPDALNLISTAADNGVVVAGWCRAVRLMAAADVLYGHNVVGHADYQTEYEAAGATYLGNDYPPILEDNILTIVRSRFYRTAGCDSIAAVLARNHMLRVVDEQMMDDVYGDGDGILEAGESIELNFTLINNKNDSICEATVNLIIDDATLTIDDGQCYLGTVASKDTVFTSADPMQFSIPADYTSRIDSFFLEVVYNGDEADTFTFTAAIGHPGALIIDDNMLGELSPYYTRHFDNFLIPHNVVSSSPVPSTSDMLGYDMVIWYIGTLAADPLSAEEIDTLKAFMDGGGNLFLTGQGIAAQMDMSGQTDFLNDYLKCSYLANNYVPVLLGVSGGHVAVEGDSLSFIGTGSAGNQTSPDHISPLNGGFGEMTYLASSDYAAVSYEGDYSLMFFGFGFEGLAASSTRWMERETAFLRVLDFFAFPLPAAAPVTLAINIAPGEDAARITNHSPDILWTYDDAGAQPQQYFQVQVGSDGDWTIAEMWDTGPVSGSESSILYDGAELVDGQWYNYRVRVHNGVLWSPWIAGSFRMNSIPVPANLQPDGMVDITVNPPVLCHATAVDGEGDALTYSYQLLGDADMTELIEEASGLPGGAGDTTMWQTTTDLDDYEDYYWRCRCTDPLEDGAWSAVAGFIAVPAYVCGDANSDGLPDVGDAVYIINYVFKGGPEPYPIDAGNVNCDAICDVGDAVYLINYVFKGGPDPCAGCP